MRRSFSDSVMRVSREQKKYRLFLESQKQDKNNNVKITSIKTEKIDLSEKSISNKKQVMLILNFYLIK